VAAIARLEPISLVFSLDLRCSLTFAKPATQVGSDFADGENMDLSAIALQGINQAENQLYTATSGLASAGASPNSPGVDVVDVASQMVAMNSAEILLQLNLSTLKTADQLQKM
jgi:hypothetical protein